MEDIIKNMPLTGICDLDIEKCIFSWNKASFSISQYKEEFRLIVADGEDLKLKASISKIQAHELIGKMDLNMEQSAIFRHGRTWR